MTVGYPTRSSAEAAWVELAGQIHASLPGLSDTAAMEKAALPGELTIIGSGIGVMGFTRDAEQYIDDAEYVLFCVADPVTQVWLRTRRPDAIDLYALYDDRKPRYHTYMQMTEAMLCHVRQGKRVVAVFYGHPGIFVLSTHRAVKIARREGHRAQMRPGVSALDWLCADLGIDPAYPGLQTFEATDMLLRRRAIDIGAHVVLWQVGLIAELGFRRRGFHNRQFAHLVDYLRGYYKPDHPVVHYIASRYPTLPPTIDTYTLDELLDPVVHARISGISTFYIAPAKACTVDVDFAREVGLIKPGQRVGRPRLTRPLDRYGPREIRAIAALKDFQPPPDYHFQTDTAAARFLLALSEQPALRREFQADPTQGMRGFTDLSGEERKLLASRRTARTQLAARGAAVSITPNEQFVVNVETQPALAKQWMQMLATAVKSSPKNWQPVDDWLSANYQGMHLADVPDAVASVQAWLLLMWNGIYATSGSQPDVLMVMAGAPGSNGNANIVSNGAVYLNASALYNVTFSAGQLSFTEGKGNPCSGLLTFSVPGASTAQTVSGKIWTTAQGEPSANNFTATLQPLPSNPLSVWTGEYTTVVTQTNEAGPPVAVYLPGSSNPSPALYVDGSPVTGGSFGGSKFSWSGGSLVFALDANTSGKMTLSGTIGDKTVTGASVAGASTSFEGQYATQHLVATKGTNVWQPFYPLGFTQTNNAWTLSLGSSSFSVTYANRQITWTNGPSAMQNGQVFFAVNPFTNAAYFVGTIWANGATQPTTPNFQGVASANALINFTGNYPTTLDGKPADTLSIGGTPSNLRVAYGSQQVNYTFFTGQLSGTTAGGLKLDATFKYVPADSTSPPTFATAFTGTQTSGSTKSNWSSSLVSNDVLRWVGTYQTSTVSATNGSLIPNGPTLTIAATDESSFTLTITANGQSTTITNAQYQITGNTLYWSGQNVTGDSRFNNGAISFFVDARGQTGGFKGVFYQSAPAPTAINWSGTLAQNNGGGGGTPGWVFGVVAAVLGILGAGGIIGLIRWCRSSANGYVRVAQDESVEMQKLKCD